MQKICLNQCLPSILIGFLTRKKRAVPETSAHDILPMGSYLNYDLLSTTLPSISTKLTSPTQIYAIKKSEGFFHTEKPVTSTLISDVMYDFNNMEKKAEPTEMNSAVLENYSHIPQTVTRTRFGKCRLHFYVAYNVCLQNYQTTL